MNFTMRDMVSGDVLHALQFEGRHEGRVGWKRRSSRLVLSTFFNGFSQL